MYDDRKNSIRIEALFDQLNRTNEELRRKTDKLGQLKMTLSLLQKSEIQQLTERIEKANTEIVLLKEKTNKIDHSIELYNNNVNSDDCYLLTFLRPLKNHLYLVTAVDLIIIKYRHLISSQELQILKQKQSKCLQT